MNTSSTKTRSQLEVATKSLFMTRVYQWMTIGILCTAFISSYLGSMPELVMSIVKNPILFYGLMIAQIAMVFGLSGFINKISTPVAFGIFIFYALLNGVTFSTLFLVYTQSSIHSAFFTTATGFAGLSIFGYVTKKDLGPVGSFCAMGLFGMIGYSILALFFPSMMGGVAGLVYSLVGLLIFAGLTAYDTQKIKMIGMNVRTEEEKNKATVMGALTLYLDFINLFLMVLRLMGGGRSRD